MFFDGYERLGEPLAARWLFARRLGWNLCLALVLVFPSLIVGILGYHHFENVGWIDAYDRAAMILSGMGPYSEPLTTAGKIFAGTYALYSGLLVVATTTLILAPIFHRVLHSLHVPDEDDKDDAKGQSGGP